MEFPKGQWKIISAALLFWYMRLDQFLKISRLIPRRSVAQEFCDTGLVSVNGLVAKSSKEVKVGDSIAIKRRLRLTTVLVIQVPSSKQMSKEAAGKLYEVTGDEVLGDELDLI